jgi:hypothetical protein
MIAANAQPILDARMRGFKPDEMVLVSLVGKINAANHTVHAKPHIAYDWRWVRDLDVCVHVDQQTDWVPALKAIASERPKHLSLWNSAESWGAKVYLVPTAEDVSKPVRQWAYELDFLPWLDFQNEEFSQWN